MNGTVTILDRVIIKPIWKYPIPTNHEVKLLLNYFGDYEPMKVALGLLAFQGLRPSEVSKVLWGGLEWNEKQDDILTMRHICYKPMRRLTVRGTNFYYKEVKKDFYSRWLANQLVGMTRLYPEFTKSRRVFPMWNTCDGLQKQLCNLRKKVRKGVVGEEYKFLLDQNFKVVSGDRMTKYRVTLHSLRRFAFTFHYYVTFKQDVVALAKTFGHEKIETTFKHYIMPKESIGLTKEMIDKRISIDNFIHLRGKNQTVIPEYMEEIKPKFLTAGQTELNKF